MTNKILTSKRNAPINTQKAAVTAKTFETHSMKSKIEFKVPCGFLTAMKNEKICENDFKLAKADILHWKAHVVRSVNQEAAKQDQLKMISVNPNCALIIMDWAMKFPQLRYREKQSDWFGKRGLSWHISTVITGDLDISGKLEMQSYAHLFDACQKDWFAVCSILENTLGEFKAKKPHITQVYLRSDEAGCYHNNSLITAARSVG